MPPIAAYQHTSILNDGWKYRRTGKNYVRFEVFTAVTMKSGVSWDVTTCGSCKNRRFGGISASFIEVSRIDELGTTLAVN
jgi:hypothetical protein